MAICANYSPCDTGKPFNPIELLIDTPVKVNLAYHVEIENIK